MMPPNSLEVSEAIGGIVGQKRQRDSRTPRRFARFKGATNIRQVVECGCPSAAFPTAFSRRRLPKGRLKMIWFALQKPATTWFTDKFAIPDTYLATHGNHMRPAFDSHALERIVIHVHGLGFD